MLPSYDAHRPTTVGQPMQAVPMGQFPPPPPGGMVAAPPMAFQPPQMMAAAAPPPMMMQPFMAPQPFMAQMPHHQHHQHQGRKGSNRNANNNGHNNAAMHGGNPNYALAARTIPPMKMTAAGNYRLQMSHCGINDQNAQDFLKYAKDQLVENYRASPQGIAKAAELGVPVGFGDVPVVEVTLNRNSLTDASLKSIVEFIGGNRTIASLEILSNKLTDEGAPTIADLARSSTLERIKVGDNLFTAEGAKIIADGLRDSNSKLMQLHLSGNALGDEGVKHIANGCVASPVEVLGLREIGMGEEGWSALGTMIAAGSSVVKELHLKGNTMTEAAAQRFCAPLIDQYTLGVSPCIKVLAIPHCEIDANGCKLLCQALSKCANLVQLDISSNPIGEEGGKHVARWFASHVCPQLVSLCLSRTEIGLETVEALMEGPPGKTLAALQSLTSIDISFNPMPTETAGGLIKTLLRASTSLLTFTAYHCHIVEPCVTEVCGAIKQHPTLTDIDFSSNFSCDGNAAAWADIVANSQRLERLILTDNQMSSIGVDQIVTALRNTPNRNVAFVQLGGQSKTPPTRNIVPQALQSQLSEVLVRNRREDVNNKKGAKTNNNNNNPSPAPTTTKVGGGGGGGGSGPMSPADLRRMLGYPAPPEVKEALPSVGATPWTPPSAASPPGVVAQHTPLLAVQQPVAPPTSVVAAPGQHQVPDQQQLNGSSNPSGDGESKWEVLAKDALDEAPAGQTETALSANAPEWKFNENAFSNDVKNPSTTFVGLQPQSQQQQPVPVQQVPAGATQFVPQMIPAAAAPQPQMMMQPMVHPSMHQLQAMPQQPAAPNVMAQQPQMMVMMMPNGMQQPMMMVPGQQPPLNQQMLAPQQQPQQ